EFAAAAAQYAKAVAVVEKMDPAALASQPVPRNSLQYWRLRSDFLRKADQAVRDLDFALKQPEKLFLLEARVHYLLNQHQLTAAVESAAKMKEVFPKAAAPYQPACAYAACAAAAKGTKIPDATAPQFEELAGEVMTLLKQAVANGFTNSQVMKQNK